MLHRESCLDLCDRSILQRLKWIEIYEEFWGTMNRETTFERRHLFGAVKRRSETSIRYLDMLGNLSLVKQIIF